MKKLFQTLSKIELILGKRRNISSGLITSNRKMSSNYSTVAIIQMTSTAQKEKNLLTCIKLIEKAKAKGAKVIFLPEAFDFVAESKEESLALAEPIDGPLINILRAKAKDLVVWLSLGGFHEKDLEQSENRLYNSHVIINSLGQIVSIYRKCHLFDVTLQTGQQLFESDYIIPGNEIVPPILTPVGKVGLGICYDIRFPEMSIALVQMGADILTYPSAFMVTTGLAHWEVLLRCRAVEGQCYVIAAAQTGFHNPKRSSYGHSMIVDPWGSVIAQCHEGTDVALADIDIDYIRKIRTNMPLHDHRRYDLYGQTQTRSFTPTSKVSLIENNGTGNYYRFGQVNLTANQIFYRTSLSMAFVNKKPVLPGHVLVAPLRIVEKLTNLQVEELNDLFQCVQHVQRVIEQKYKTTSSTVTIQDGPDAGQTVKHVHVHIIPRKPGDFENNDSIYERLHSHDKPGTSAGTRSSKDMAEEASALSLLFLSSNIR